MALTAAVIGLGSMGYGVAQSVLREGHTVYGIDIAEDRMQQFRDDGGAEGELADVAAELDAVVSVVLNDAQTAAVLFGDDGVVPKLSPGAVVVSCATVSPSFSREMQARCDEHDVHYLDAPISGGAAKSATGDLSVMASGSEDAFTKARPILDAMAATVFELDDTAGAGSAMKAVNQMLAGVHIAALAEAMTFAIGQGIAPAQLMEVIPACAGTSWMFEDRGPHIVEGDYEPRSSVDIWPKDLGIVLEISRNASFSAPLTAAALQQFLAAQANGLGGEDDAAVAKIYARNAGVELPGVPS